MTTQTTQHHHRHNTATLPHALAVGRSGRPRTRARARATHGRGARRERKVAPAAVRTAALFCKRNIVRGWSRPAATFATSTHTASDDKGKRATEREGTANEKSVRRRRVYAPTWQERRFWKRRKSWGAGEGTVGDVYECMRVAGLGWKRNFARMYANAKTVTTAQVGQASDPD